MLDKKSLVVKLDGNYKRGDGMNSQRQVQRRFVCVRVCVFVDLIERQMVQVRWRVKQSFTS